MGGPSNVERLSFPPSTISPSTSAVDLCGGPAICTRYLRNLGMDRGRMDLSDRAHTPAALVSAIIAAGPFVSLLGLFGSSARGTGAKGGIKRVRPYLTTCYEVAVIFSVLCRAVPVGITRRG